MGIAVVAISVLIVSGCGPSSGSETVNVVEASAATLIESHTVEIDSRASSAGSSSMSRMLYDFQHRVGEKFATTGTSAAPQPEEIFDGSTVYINLRGLGPGGVQLHLPPAVEWIKLTSTPGASAVAALFDPTTPVAGLATVLQELGPLVVSVQRAGAVTVDGIPTTAYKVGLDQGRFQRLTGATGRTPLRLAAPLGLWVDDRGRVRRLQLSISAPPIGTTTLTDDYTHYGRPLRIDVPRPGEVVTLQQWVTAFCAAMKTNGMSGGYTWVDSGTTSAHECH